MKQYLTGMKETVPAWLANYQSGDKPAFSEVCGGRVVYYPGAGDDGQPVHLFAGTQSAHVFLYVDYLLKKEELLQQLDESGFAGYHVLGMVEYSEHDLTPNRWRPHLTMDEVRNANPNRFAHAEPYCLLKVFERDGGLDDAHGAERFAVIFLCGDGIASYDAIFGGKNVPPPFAVVLQDHGFGGNYDKFGAGGLMEKIAERSHCYPEYLLVATEGTEQWNGFEALPGLSAVKGGMHHSVRKLYKKES